MEPLCLDADGKKANALHLGILLRLQIVAVRRKWLQAVFITFGEARAWQPLPVTCARVVELVILRVPERRCFHVPFVVFLRFRGHLRYGVIITPGGVP